MVRLQAEILPQSPAAAKGGLIVTTYQWMKAECGTSLFGLQEEATAKINKLLADLPPTQLVRGDEGGSLEIPLGFGKVPRL